MVCKEDVFNWYKLLSPSKRIEVMCGLLHMCFPLELRFLGSCLENLARKDYNFLREAELKANSPVDLGKVTDIQSEVTRARLVTYLALLHSTNHECASMVYNHILTCVDWSTRTLPMEPELAKELLLMMTVAANSPAFTIDQRQIICDHISTLKNLFHNYIHQEECNEHCLHNQKQASERGSSVNNGPRPVHITSIKMKGYQKRACDGHCEFHMQVTWSNNKVTKVSRTYQELHDFHVQLLKLFPDEAGAHRQERKIPYLQSGRRGGSSSDTDAEQSMVFVEEYTKALSSMPEHLLLCDHMMTFFGPQPLEDTLTPSREICNTEGLVKPYQSGPQVPVAVYNPIVIPVVQETVPGMATVTDNQAQPMASTNLVNTGTTNHKLAYTNRVPSLPIPQGSPLPSPLTSPHESPTGYHVNKPSTVGDWLKEIRLHKYSSLLSKYTMQELFSLNEEALESMGMVAGARKKFLIELENLKKDKRNQNGLISIPIEGGQRPGTPQSPQLSFHTPPSTSYTSQVDSNTDSLSSDCSPVASPLPDLEENKAKIQPAHFTVAQKSASMPSIPTPEETRLVPVPVYSHLDARIEPVRHHPHNFRPTGPMIPAPSMLNPRFLVRSPLRHSKPLGHRINPGDEATFIGPADYGSGNSGLHEVDQPGEMVAASSTSVLTTSHMLSATSVTPSNQKTSCVVRPSTLGEVEHLPSHPQAQFVPAPPNFSYPPPPLVSQGVGPGQLPSETCSMPVPPEHPITHGYSSDSSLYQQYSTTIPLHPSMPLPPVNTHVTMAGYPGVTTVTYVGGGPAYVPTHNSMPVTTYQFNQTQPVPPPMLSMAQSHCHNGCSSCGCPGNPGPPYLCGQMIQYPAFIPTSNGLISPSIPNFNMGHIPGMNGMAPHLRGVFPGSMNPPPQKGRVLECYNCGQRGHRGSECKEQSMDRITHGGMYHMKYIEEEDK